MPRCVACDCKLKQDGEMLRGYCDVCQKEIRVVFDKDAFALGQYQKTQEGKLINTLDWTNISQGEDCGI